MASLHRLSVAAGLLAFLVLACAKNGEDRTEESTQDVTGTAVANKDKLFDGDMYYVRITGWDTRFMSPASLRDERTTWGASVAIHKTNPKSGAHCPDGETGESTLVYRTKQFSLRTSGNMTNGTPKSSYKIGLEDKEDRLFKMGAINLKAMWNDVSQMREALAWRLMGKAGIATPRHTYAKLCINDKYYGLYSMIEQVDKTFIKDNFDKNDKGNLYKVYWEDIGPGDLGYRKASDGDDSGKQYKKSSNIDNRTYQLKTNDKDDDDRSLQSYDDLATFIRTLNGVGLDGDESKFDTDAFKKSMESVMDVKGFLRWASVNTLLGAWDNYWGTPANFYLYNSGKKNDERGFMRKPYFTWIPWDYDNTFGNDFFNGHWERADILDFEKASRAYHGGREASNLPLLRHVLANKDFRAYYLDHLEYLNDTFFTERWLKDQIGDESRGLRARVQTAAYLESDSPTGAPHTGRQFTNDQVYRHGFQHDEIQQGALHSEGLLHWVRMRHDNVKDQLAEIRRTTRRGASGASFPASPSRIPE